MAEPEKQYEYGRTPEETDSGVLGFFNFLRGVPVDAFTPERREVITAPETTYEMVSDGRYRPKITPGEYGPVEKGLEYMPVVQAARGALDFAGKFATDGKVREETGAAIAKGIGQIFKDYQEGLTYGYRSGTDEMSSYDPVEKRVVEPDVLLPLGLGMAASLVAPVKGPGMVAGMFAGPKAATANPKRFKLADEMAKKGRSREEIWQKTGLFRWERNGEPISDWRFEISDEQAKAFFNPRVQTPTGRFKAGAEPVLSDLFEHPEFYKNYPGITDVSGSSLMDDLQKKRAVLVTKLAELKASNKDPDEYAKEYQKLQDQDGDLLREYLESDIPEVKTSITGSEKVGPPYTTKAQRMERSVADISLGPMKSSDWGGANYSPYMDKMGLKNRPGGKNLYDAKKYDWIPWDDQGRFFQKFSDLRYGEALNKAREGFRKAGISLDGPSKGNAQAGMDINNPAFGVVYKLRKWKGGPEDTIDPESLPDYLKKQLDELLAGGRTYYKQKLDADRVFREAAIHEGQHAIQYREGFEGGSNRREFRYTNIKDPQTGKKLKATEIYMRTLGEAEARLAESRKDLTDKERKERFPWTKEGGLDRREEDLLLRKDPGMPASYYDDPISASMTPAEKLMKFSPRTTELKLNDVFRSDIPKESWLEEKVKYVKSRGKDPRGFNFTGVDTGNFKDDFIPRIPVSELVKLKGRNKEQENVRKESLASLIEVMGRTGKLPLIGEAFPTNKGQYGADKEYRPFIKVDYEGIPTVSEGNHRIMAAAALGMKDLPVEIRYFDGGERKATGAFKPENILKNSVKVSPDD